MADVFLATRLGPAGFAKLVVIKRLREELASLAEGPSYRGLLLDEAKLSARLQHPNIVQTFEVGDVGGVPYLAMEYLEGQPLDRVLAAAQRAYLPLPLELVLRVITDVLAGLDYAHGLVDYDGSPLGIVHRDVSPHNVFVTYHGEVKLVDFGVAKYAYSSVETEAGLIKGKLTYMAPEQALRAPIDCRADLFPVGILLWECLAGRTMMPRNNPPGALQKLLYEPLQSLAEVRPDLPPALAAICDRALERDPEKRYQCADEMRADLEDLVTQLALPRADLQGFVLRLFEREREARTRQIQAAMIAESAGDPMVDFVPTGPTTGTHVSQALGTRRTARESVAPLSTLGEPGAFGAFGGYGAGGGPGTNGPGSGRRTTGAISTISAIARPGRLGLSGQMAVPRAITQSQMSAMSAMGPTGNFGVVGTGDLSDSAPHRADRLPLLAPLPLLSGVPGGTVSQPPSRRKVIAGSALGALALAAVVAFAFGGRGTSGGAPARRAGPPSAASAAASARTVATSGGAPDDSPRLALRLCGSNTIGGELAPALVEAFLAYQGAGAIERVADRAAGAGSQRRVVATLDGERIAVELEARGTATAFEGLAAGRCDIGMASRAISSKEDDAIIRAGLGDLRAPASEHVLALDGIAVIVHPNNPLRGLDREALHDVFTGEITDWSALGGEAGPIRVLARDDRSGTFDTFQHLVLGDDELAAGAQRFAQSDALADAVASDPAAIGFIGLAYVRSAKALAVAEPGALPMLPTAFTVATESYLLSRRLYFYTAAQPRSPLVAQLVSFALSPRGQAVVARAQFVDLGLTLRDEPPCDIRCPRAYAALVDNARRVSVDFRFQSNSSELDSRAVLDLDRLVNLLRAHPDERLYLLGFSDTGGSVKNNTAVSLERARAVERELATRGVRVHTVKGFGSVLPVAANDSEAGRERNRRVEVWLAK